MIGFGEVLASAVEAFGPLSVGIDPHAFLLEEWGLPDSAAGVREFGLRVVEAAAEDVGIVKPQVAFFERFGAAGYAALEEVLREARARGLVVIADAKRGDIGSTVDAYAQAWLTPGSPIEADAMTMYAYQGVGSIIRSLDYAAQNGKGVFVVAATSNPEAAELQRAVTASGRSVARAIIEDVIAFNASAGAGAGAVGVVVGATVDLADYGVDVSRQATPPLLVLAPGFGEQGAALSDVRERYGWLARTLIVHESRSLLSAGPRDLRAAIAGRAAEVRAALG